MKSSKLMGLNDVALCLELSSGYVNTLASKGELAFEETSSGKIFYRDEVERFRLKKLRKRVEGM